MITCRHQTFSNYRYFQTLSKHPSLTVHLYVTNAAHLATASTSEPVLLLINISLINVCKIVTTTSIAWALKPMSVKLTWCISHSTNCHDRSTNIGCKTYSAYCITGNSILELGIIHLNRFIKRLNSAEQIESKCRRVKLVWPSAKPVPAVCACW